MCSDSLRKTEAEAVVLHVGQSKKTFYSICRVALNIGAFPGS